MQASLTLRNSAKSFARSPGLATVLILTIAIGVGANASVYGFIQGLTQPVSSASDTGRMVSLFSQDRSREPGPLSRGQVQRIANGVAAFDWIEAARIQPHDITLGDHAEIANIAAVMPNLARALNLSLGKGAVISHRLWEREFGGAASAIGRPIRIHGVAMTITGVAPEQLEGIYRDLPIDIWTPLPASTLQDADANQRDLWVFAHLRRSVTAREAETAVNACCGKTDPVSVVPFTGTPPRMARGLSRIAWLLTFAAGTLFFVACVNVGSLLLGRAFRRTGETSLRIAVGATRPNLIAQLLADSIVISLAGGVLGLLLAVWSERVIPDLLFEQDAEQLVFAPSATHIVLVSLLCIGVILLCGVVPVLTIDMDRPWTILQRESGWPSGRTQRLQAGMAVGQIAMCSVLVIFAALLMETFHLALQTSAGSRLGDPVLATVQGPGQPALALDYFSEVEERAGRMSHGSPPAWTLQLPGNLPMWRSFRIQPAVSQLRDVELNIDSFTADSLETFDPDPVAGRLFSVDDPHSAALINERAAAELFGLDSVGVVLQDPANTPTEIIGIVKRRSPDASKEDDATIFYNYTSIAASSSPPDRVVHARFRAPVVLPPSSVELNVNVVSPSYFAMMGLSLAAGVEFPQSWAPGQSRAGILNQEAADLYFGGQAPGSGVIDDLGIRTNIIGVVRSQTLGTFQQRAEPTIYFPMAQDTPPRMTVILEASGKNDAVLADLRRRIESLPGPHLPPVLQRLSTQLAQSGLATLRIAAMIVGVSASISLLLSFFGLLKIQTDAERQHRRDLALRVALGAQRWRVVLTVFARAGRFALAGTLIGTVASLALLRLVARDMDVAYPPFWVWLLAPLLPTAAVMAAAVLPACRASTTNPLMILRDDR